ncbi:TPA: hypothetical protein ACKONR_001364 [Clostridioides difficile]|uniref:hypothetical protein n=1 Tax=Clostridioides difficile TaxID=1496 RepID=UPI00038CA136|nr:hypothetical protein [Clostridioides difficile]EQE83328.1 hypothetical protein QCW_3342 [Clostridioides difficile CD69]MBY1132048.1 hypothetical protein [Clostridioides difficile]MBY1882868.1 hypothetical protein [Clostridioides difficile]MBZ0781847.1 hypothetical protein [Clostridioides difficile]MBZ0854969.1 hypothetical protein [Clostridioides difficile]
MFDKLIGVFYSFEGIENLVLFKNLKIEVFNVWYFKVKLNNCIELFVKEETV